jgi:hypothetical protein
VSDLLIDIHVQIDGPEIPLIKIASTRPFFFFVDSAPSSREGKSSAGRFFQRGVSMMAYVLRRGDTARREEHTAKADI